MGNKESKQQQSSMTTDDRAIDDEQKLATINKTNNSTLPLPLPPPPIQSTVAKIAPRPPRISHNPIKLIATSIKGESIDNETLDNSLCINTASLSPTSCLSDVDCNMATNVLRTTPNDSAPNFNIPSTMVGTFVDANVAGIGSMGGRTSMPAALSQFGFIQAHQNLTSTSFPKQQSSPSTTHTTTITTTTSTSTSTSTSTTAVPIKSICGTTLAQLEQQPLQIAEMLRKELNHQKIRNDNRERKKRWREQNEERNKDNDLRCRVNKRAHNLFGKEDSEQKRRWINDEFVKRQCRRRNKEMRRTVMDDAVLSAGSSSSCSSTAHTPSIASDVKDNLPHTISEQLPVLQEACMSVLFNNMGTLPPDVGLKLAEEIQLLETNIKSPGIDNEHTLSQQLMDFLQRLQQLHSPSLAGSPGTASTLATSSLSSIFSSASSAPVTIKSEKSGLLEISIPSSIPPVNQVSDTSKILSPGKMVLENQNNSPPPPVTPQSPLQPYSGVLLATPSPRRYDSSLSNDLSALLVKTLQQTALIYQEKLGDAMTPPLQPPTPPTTTTEYRRCDQPQHLFQLYPSDAIMTLKKINTEWARQ